MVDVISVIYLLVALAFVIGYQPQVPYPGCEETSKATYRGFGIVLVLLILLSIPALIQITDSKDNALCGFGFSVILGFCAYFNYRSKCLP